MSPQSNPREIAQQKRTVGFSLSPMYAARGRKKGGPYKLSEINSRAHARLIVDSSADGDILYDLIVCEERTAKLARAIDRGLESGRVSWARLYRDIAQKIGRKFEVDAEVRHRLGVPMSEAEAAVRAMQSASEDEDEVAAECWRFLEAYERRKGRKLLAEPFQVPAEGEP